MSGVVNRILSRLRGGTVVALIAVVAVTTTAVTVTPPAGAAEAGVATTITVDGPVVRWGGADRYAVSANISATNFPNGAGTVFVANGLASADALAAGPVAGISEGPILLVKKDSIPRRSPRNWIG